MERNANGILYRVFTISTVDGSFPIPVHRLVAFQKFGEEALVEGIHTRHKDGNSLNNLDENIVLGTATDNAMDRPKEARQKHAAKGNQQLTPELIGQIRADHSQGLGYKRLRKKYGLPLSTLSYYLSTSAKRTSFSFQL